MTLQKFKQTGSEGFSFDMQSDDLPVQPMAWSGGNNMRFKDGYIEKMLGHNAPNGAPIVTPYHIDFVQGSGQARYETYAGLQKLYALSGSTHTDITRGSGNYTGTIDNRWTSAILSSTLLLNNGVDVPQFWAGNPATPAADIAAWPSTLRCKVLRTFDNYVFALNITESGTNLPSTIRWSTGADPGTLPASYVAAATNDAGRVSGVLSSTPDYVIDGKQLGNTFMIYKENSTYAAQYVGGQEVFSLRSIAKTSGILAIECVASFSGGHAVLSDGDIVINAGLEGPQSIIDNRMRRWLFNSIDTDNRQRSFAVENRRMNEIWFCFPSVGMTWPNIALIWNYKDNTFGIRDLPNATHANAGAILVNSAGVWDAAVDTWDNTDGIWAVDEYSQATPRVMIASTDPGLYLADITRSFNGAPMTAFCERTGLDFSEPERMKLCRGIRPRFDAAAGTIIQIYVGFQNDLDDAIDWGQPINFTVGMDLRADCFVQGRFLAVKFLSNAQGPWRMQQFDADIMEMGFY